MPATVSSLAQALIDDAFLHDLDIADIVSDIRSISILSIESEEIKLQSELLKLRTLKLKLSKL